MSSFQEVMLQRLESFGPQLFDLMGVHSLWVDIIGTLDNKSIDCLYDLIEGKTCEQKYNLAKRILIEGFDKVVNDSKPLTTTIETASDDNEVANNMAVSTPDQSEEESAEEQTNERIVVEKNETQNLVIDMNTTEEGDEEEVTDNAIMITSDESEEESTEGQTNQRKIEQKNETQNEVMDMNTTEEGAEEEESELTDNERRLMTPDLSEEDSPQERKNRKQTEDKNLTQNETIDMNMSEDEEEVIVPLNESSELLDSSSSYADASQISPIPMSPESYKSALSSPQKKSPQKELNLSPNKSLEILCESQSQSMSTNMSSSTPSKDNLEDRLSGQILNLSPITSQYFQSSPTKLTLSPTLSLNMSSTSSHSPKSTLSSKSSKRSFKSTEKIIEEYESLVPYESYCSEGKYFKPNENNSQSDSVISDILYDKIIDQNIKNIESND